MRIAYEDIPGTSFYHPVFVEAFREPAPIRAGGPLVGAFQVLESRHQLLDVRLLCFQCMRDAIVLRRHPLDLVDCRGSVVTTAEKELPVGGEVRVLERVFAERRVRLRICRL